MSELAPSPKTCSVQFLPSGAKVDVPAGTTILDAARMAGVFVDSLCGGDGVCGKCRVIVRRGIVKGGTTDSLTRDQIREGFILACEASVTGNVLVEVPAESDMHARLRETDFAEQRLSEIAALERQPEEIDPLVRKYCIKVEPATLEHSRSDLDRLKEKLQTLEGAVEYQMGLKVIRRLPEVIRDPSRTVTVTTAYRGALREITEVAGGDSSKPNLAVAVDVGTTSIVAHLVELSTGQTLGTAAKYNSQAVYGADVLRRIL